MGEYLRLCYPPLVDERNHSRHWVHKQLLQAELNEVVMRRVAIFRKNAAIFKERMHA